MKFFAFFFVALAAILALVGADSLRGEQPVDRVVRSAAPGKHGGGGHGGGGYGGGYGGGGYGHGYGHKG
ncbi:unnamed protein product [Arctia plantaginis]|uniref:Uncharacterized protein n=1 Tax=Arctia plantaginis TaxID=874455 RepID=A0A8S0ZPZ2_ARCPL|nr:unnamed protein product [Arctia plantaginis]CAB3234926.1 unnamed protein product [Arctia plantaginis]CAB3234927.1 unnamed protein product [Arctia plantaginis]